MRIYTPVQDTPPHPEPDQTSSPHNVTFTTGLITLILVSFGAGITIKVTDQLGFSAAGISRVYSFLITTFISVYWVMANQELREFISRVFYRVVQSRFPND